MELKIEEYKELADLPVVEGKDILVTHQNMTYNIKKKKITKSPLLFVELFSNISGELSEELSLQKYNTAEVYFYLEKNPFTVKL